MGLLDKLSGKTAAKFEDKIKYFIMKDEEIEFSTMAKEDFVCLTNKKLIFLDGNLLSSKKSITMLPYNRITSVSLETGGMGSFSKNVIVSFGSRHATIDTYDVNKAQELAARILHKIQ